MYPLLPYDSELIGKISEMIPPEIQEQYKRELEIIWEELIYIRNNLIVLRRLVEFPFHLFAYAGGETFWKLTKKAYFDSTVMHLSNILSNGDISILKLKKRINHTIYKRSATD